MCCLLGAVFTPAALCLCNLTPCFSHSSTPSSSPPSPAAKLGLLAPWFCVSSRSGGGADADAGAAAAEAFDTARLRAAVVAAPALLEASVATLRASWAALEAAFGADLARGVVRAAPEVLASGGAVLAQRAAALEALSALSRSWAARCAAARADARQLAAVMAAGAEAGARLKWLVSSEQRLAPGDTPLAALLEAGARDFADIYPAWRLAGEAGGGGGGGDGSSGSGRAW